MSKLASRKLWTALVAVVVLVAEGAGITDLGSSVREDLVVVVLGYLASQGAVDTAKALRKPEAAPADPYRT